MLPDLTPAREAPIVSRGPVEPSRGRPRHAIDHASWIWDRAAPTGEPQFRRFRLGFAVGRDDEPVRLQFSADQFAVLFIDGHWVARGPDAAPPWHYGFAQYRVELPPGEHVIDVFAWWAGGHVARSRMTVAPGFALAGVGGWHGRLSTGTADWRVAVVEGFAPDPDARNGEVLEAGANTIFDARRYFAVGPSWNAPAVVVPPAGPDAYGIRGTPCRPTPSTTPGWPTSTSPAEGRG